MIRNLPIRSASMVVVLLTGSVWAQSPAPKKSASGVQATKADDEFAQIKWTDAKSLTVEGMGWTELAAPFDRLPSKAKSIVRQPVWELSRHSSGIAIYFRTDATKICARWKLTSDRLAMPHMCAIGVSGLDLYTKLDNGQWRWVNAGRPEYPVTTTTLANNIDPGKRDYLLYLPLYNGVSSLSIGVPEANTVEPATRADNHKSPIVFYGTSITHGACASRPGMCHPAILGRRLDRPVINLGFSGNGPMDLEMAPLLAELDAAVYVLDCLPNMGPQQVNERAEKFVTDLRARKPNTPILLVEDRSFTNSSVFAGTRNFHKNNRAALKSAYDKLLAKGIKGLEYLEGEHLLGDDGEGANDASHPSDLGFMRQAEVMLPILKKMLTPAG